jgi:hypothetical protein
VLAAAAASVVLPTSVAPATGAVTATDGGGLIAMTVPIPVRAGDMVPPFEAKVTVALTLPAAVGLNRTTTV